MTTCELTNQYRRRRTVQCDAKCFEKQVFSDNRQPKYQGLLMLWNCACSSIKWRRCLSHSIISTFGEISRYTQNIFVELQFRNNRRQSECNHYNWQVLLAICVFPMNLGSTIPRNDLKLLLSNKFAVCESSRNVVLTLSEHFTWKHMYTKI